MPHTTGDGFPAPLPAWALGGFWVQFGFPEVGARALYGHLAFKARYGSQPPTVQRLGSQGGSAWPKGQR